MRAENVQTRVFVTKERTKERPLLVDRKTVENIRVDTTKHFTINVWMQAPNITPQYYSSFRILQLPITFPLYRGYLRLFQYMQLGGAPPFGSSENPRWNSEFGCNVGHVILVRILCSQLSEISIMHVAQYSYTGPIRVIKGPSPYPYEVRRDEQLWTDCGIYTKF
jgi:hypothetical protein